jgi:hypothetical protein
MLYQTHALAWNPKIGENLHITPTIPTTTTAARHSQSASRRRRLASVPAWAITNSYEISARERGSARTALLAIGAAQIRIWRGMHRRSTS